MAKKKTEKFTGGTEIKHADGSRTVIDDDGKVTKIPAPKKKRK